MIRWKIIIKTVKTSRERVQIRQKLYVRIGFGQKIIVYSLLVRVNNDTKAWKKVIYIKQPTTTDWRKPWSKLNSVWFIGFKCLRKTLIVM